jgi:hypothetical protein
MPGPRGAFNSHQSEQRYNHNKNSRITEYFETHLSSNTRTYFQLI